jgi:hypothetical protein
VALALLAGAAAAQDPFLPGARWTLPGDPAAPAIPRSVAFGARDNVAWSASSGTSPAASAIAAHAQGPAVLLSREPSPPGSSGSAAVAAGLGPWSFALAQVAAPDAWHRRTAVSGFLADDLGSGTGSVPAVPPRWVHAFAFTANGSARLACDAAGASALVAAFDDAAHVVHVERLDGPSGAVVWARDLAAAGLQEIASSADGARALLACGQDLFVLDADGATLHHATLAAASTALAFAGDGRTLAHGAPGTLRVLTEGAPGFALSRTLFGSAGEMAVRAALDGAGRTLAVAWWNATTGTAWRFEVWDLASGTRLVERAFAGAAGGLQDLPTGVALTSDGARAAFSSWGTGSSAPEVGIWDRATNAYPLEADLPGSAFALALDASGTRLLVAQKSTHANVLSATGDVRLFDTGERDLQVLGTPRVGGTLHLAARAPGATGVLMLEGTPARHPILVPGVGGALLLRRSGIAVVRVRTDASGRADFTWSIPSDPSLVGTTRYYQAAFRSPAGLTLGRVLVSALVL